MSEKVYGPGTVCSGCGDEIGVYAPDGAEYCGRCTDDPRPNDGNHEGVCCLKCHSVFFNVGKLLRHVKNRNHTWFKSGDDMALNVRTFTPEGFEFDND